MLRYHGIDDRSNWATVPTVACVRDASETRLVLEHQPQRPVVVPARHDLIQIPLEFFSSPHAPKDFPGEGPCQAPAIARQHPIDRR